MYGLFVLIVAGAPFVLVMGLARRWSERSRRIGRDVGAVVGFGVTAASLMCLWLGLGLSNGTAVWVCVGLAWLWSAGAVYELTNRWWMTGAAIAAGVGSVWVLFAIEERTHGPWYIRSQGLAMLASIGSGAVAWHTAMLAVLGAWAKSIGRRERRAESGGCVGCGYDLSGGAGRAGGAVERCPECGRANMQRESTRPRPSPDSRAS